MPRRQTARKAITPNVRRVWLTFDLGLQGNYDGLYRWLDEQEATECGDNVASFNFHFVSNLHQELGNALAHIPIDYRAARIYLIVDYGSVGDMYGTGLKAGWLMGHQKRALWDGYAPKHGGAESPFGWEPPEK